VEHGEPVEGAVFVLTRAPVCPVPFPGTPGEG
jgi:hypothetical protein